MCKNCCSSRMLFIWTVLSALLFAGSMLLAFWGMSRIINSQIHSKTELKEGTEQWDRFVELPFSLDYTVRFFEVNNPDDVLYNGQPPNLTESKPYTYKLTLKKTDIRFDDPDEDSVTYRRNFNFEFQSLGEAKDTDEVTIVNPLLMATLQLRSTVEKLALAGCLDRILGPTGMDQVFIKKPVKEILFEGIPFAMANQSDLGYACKFIRDQMPNITQDIRVIEHVEDGDYLRLALFNYKTSNYLKTSPDGLYKINRGIDNVTALGTIMQWNQGTIIPTYGNARAASNDSCQTLRGTDSTIYPPNAKKGQDLYIYNTDICRTVKLAFKSSEESYSGVKAFRYETEDTFLRSSTLNPENDCFCSKATKDASGNDNCYLDGVMDFKPCLGAPVLVSQPHFLNADSSYIEGVTGLSPNKELHGIYLLLEPNTGTPLQGMKRVQINSVLRKEPLLNMITPSTMHNGIVPVLWLEEGFSLPQEYVDELNDQYFKGVKIATGLKYALIAVSSALLVACIYFVWRKEYFKK